MVQFQLRHGNDLLAMDSIRNCDVSIFWLPWLLPPPTHYPALRSTTPIFAIENYRDLETRFRGRSRSMEMIPLDRSYMTSYLC